MKETPSVTSTCANCWPASRRNSSLSISAPRTATSTALMTAATQKFRVKPSIPERKLEPRYAPTMNIEPCVRLGMRISPKISEKPAESRNSRPPNVTLLTVSSSQKLICALSDSWLLLDLA